MQAQIVVQHPPHLFCKKEQKTMNREPLVLLSNRELDKMRRAGCLAAELISHLELMVKPGVSTLEINDEAERWT